MREGLELVPAELAVEGGPRSRSVVERDLARALQRTRRRDADESAVERAAGERGADDLVLGRRVEQRQRRRAVAEVGAGDLPGLDRLARAVEDVVGDLERDAEMEPECAAAAGEQAGGLEQLARLQRAALEVCLDGRRGVVPLTASSTVMARAPSMTADQAAMPAAGSRPRASPPRRRPIAR